VRASADAWLIHFDREGQEISTRGREIQSDFSTGDRQITPILPFSGVAEFLARKAAAKVSAATGNPTCVGR
jgi:hypothetical protein